MRALQGCLLSREMPSGPHGSAIAGVEDSMGSCCRAPGGSRRHSPGTGLEWPGLTDIHHVGWCPRKDIEMSQSETMTKAVGGPLGERGEGLHCRIFPLTPRPG